MNKAILVMDMPTKCADCTVCHITNGNAVCQARFTADAVTGKLTELYKKPDWCPLKTVEEFKTLKDEQDSCEPIGADRDICPKCGTYNETIKKRRNTVKTDTVYCWHCGQAIKI